MHNYLLIYLLNKKTIIFYLINKSQNFDFCLLERENQILNVMLKLGLQNEEKGILLPITELNEDKKLFHNFKKIPKLSLSI